jgi:hypothetical protein
MLLLTACDPPSSGVPGSGRLRSRISRYARASRRAAPWSNAHTSSGASLSAGGVELARNTYIPSRACDRAGSADRVTDQARFRAGCGMPAGTPAGPQKRSRRAAGTISLPAGRIVDISTTSDARRIGKGILRAVPDSPQVARSRNNAASPTLHLDREDTRRTRSRRLFPRRSPGPRQRPAAIISQRHDDPFSEKLVDVECQPAFDRWPSAVSPRPIFAHRARFSEMISKLSGNRF